MLFWCRRDLQRWNDLQWSWSCSSQIHCTFSYIRVQPVLRHLYWENCLEMDFKGHNKSSWCDQTPLWLFYCCRNSSLIKVIRALSLISNWIWLLVLTLQSFVEEVSLDIQMHAVKHHRSDWSEGSYFMLFSSCVSIQTPCWMSARCWEEERSSCHDQGHLWFYTVT